MNDKFGEIRARLDALDVAEDEFHVAYALGEGEERMATLRDELWRARAAFAQTSHDDNRALLAEIKRLQERLVITDEKVEAVALCWHNNLCCHKFQEHSDYFHEEYRRLARAALLAAGMEDGDG